MRQQYDRLRAALENGEFRLFYQPKVALRTGEVAGFEALIRWQHPEKGLLIPRDFLTTVETTDLLVPVSEWVMREALRQKQCWQHQGESFGVSINIFGEHLQSPMFSERLGSMLAEFPDVSPEQVELEILETTEIIDLQTVARSLQRCIGIGVRFSLDDFGTGYSSLRYLRHLPVDVVKIDRSFITNLLDDKDDLTLVRSIVMMARTMQRQVVAEGVETLEHGVPLLSFGCDQAQGFGIGRPMPADRIPEWIAQWSMPDVWRRAFAALASRRQRLSGG